MKNSNQGKWLSIFLDYKAICILLLLFLFFTATCFDTFLTISNLRNVIRQISMSAILAIGYTIIIATGCIDLSVGYMLSFCCMIAAIFGIELGLGYGIGIIMALIFGALCGTVNALLMICLNVNPFIVTLAMGQAYRGLALAICDNKPITGIGDFAKWFGQGFVGVIPVPTIIMLVVMVCFAFFINRTKAGRHIILTGGNGEASRISGINIKRVKVMAYTLMGACVGLAAVVMNGRVGSAQPTSGNGMEMDAIAAVVIGGTAMGGGYGNIVGSVLGALIVGMINNGLNLLHVSSYWQFTAKGLLILAAVGLDRATQVVMTRQQIRATR